MITLPFTSRDYNAIFDSIKEIITSIEPRAEVSLDKANVESIIAKVIAGCVDSLSYNQDANILEAFPSTARDARSVFDLLSIVGHTPKTARCAHVYMTLWNPSYTNAVTYNPFSSIQIDGHTLYNTEAFTCAQGITTNTEWYQGKLISPDKRTDYDKNSDNFVDAFYPNLSASTIKQDMYELPESHINIDSRTIRIYTPDGLALTYVDNPYLVYVTPSSFGIVPNVNKTGYSFIFSKDVSSGTVADNYYYFYVISEGYDIGTNQIPDFSGMATPSPNFSYTYTSEISKGPETANEARENVAYEFGWRDTPKAIITRYDAERAVLQNTGYVAAVDVRDGDNYSKCNPDLFDVQIFVKVTEDVEAKLDVGVAQAYQNRLQTYINRFKMLPLNYTIHIDDIVTTENENVTEIYYWYPDITIYLKEQVDSQEAGAILQEAINALFERYQYKNVNFNEVPRIVDVIDTVQNSSNMILYLDIDGIFYIDKNQKQVTKEQVTCSFTDTINIVPDQNDYTITLNTLNNTRNIQYHTVKIVDANNVVIGFDNGDGVILSQTGYLSEYGTIDYKTGELKIKFGLLPAGTQFYVYYKQETPTFCKFTNNSPTNIKIALESIKA